MDIDKWLELQEETIKILSKSRNKFVSFNPISDRIAIKTSMIEMRKKYEKEKNIIVIQKINSKINKINQDIETIRKNNKNKKSIKNLPIFKK